MSKYIIIDAEAIQKRIEELENKMRSIDRLIDRPHAMTIKCQISELKQVLTKSTPLIPEIEILKNKIFQKLKHTDIRSIHSEDELYDLIDEESEDYISNLKLDI